MYQTMADLTTLDWQPNSQWWIYKRYADQTGLRTSSTPGTNVDAVGFQDADKAKAIIVVGNKGGTTGSVNVVVKNMPSWLQSGGSTKVLLEEDADRRVRGHCADNCQQRCRYSRLQCTDRCDRLGRGDGWLCRHSDAAIAHVRASDVAARHGEDPMKPTLHSLSFVLSMAIAAALWPGTATAQTQPTQYTADWTSVNQHPAAPEWFQDGKLGIWFHWGAHTTPQFYGEWYPHYLYDTSNGGGVYQHHLGTYGDPFSNWPYDKFITGANDKKGNFVQFAPKPVSAGGNWDPDAWARFSSMRALASRDSRWSTTTASRCGTAKSTSGTRRPRDPCSTSPSSTSMRFASEASRSCPSLTRRPARESQKALA